MDFSIYDVNVVKFDKGDKCWQGFIDCVYHK